MKILTKILILLGASAGAVALAKHTSDKDNKQLEEALQQGDAVKIDDKIEQIFNPQIPPKDYKLAFGALGDRGVYYYDPPKSLLEMTVQYSGTPINYWYKGNYINGAANVAEDWYGIRQPLDNRFDNIKSTGNVIDLLDQIDAILGFTAPIETPQTQTRYPHNETLQSSKTNNPNSKLAWHRWTYIRSTNLNDQGQEYVEGKLKYESKATNPSSPIKTRYQRAVNEDIAETIQIPIGKFKWIPENTNPDKFGWLKIK